MNRYDCIVIGAGPAGATTAYHLAKKGHSVLLMDKHAFPRYKPCGGGVCPQIAEWFDFDFAPVISQLVTRVRSTFNLKDEVVVDLEEPIWMVRRDEFDHYLVQNAVSLGVEFRPNSAATGIEFNDGCWQVDAEGECHVGRYLVAADGSKGPTAKWLGLNHRSAKMAAAIEAEPRVPVEDGSFFHFDFGLIKRGYVWNFPKADGYSLGSGVFGARQQKPKGLVESLTDLSNDYGVDISKEKRFGHPINLWHGDRVLHANQALVAGEAAAVVDPFTAEGIRPAIFSGLKAAEAIHHSLAGKSSALADYTATMSQEWGREMVWASRLAAIFYRFPKTAYRVGIRNPRGFQIMTQVFMGKLGYSDVVSKAIGRIRRSLWLG